MMSETDDKLEALEAKVKKLIETHKTLKEENIKLKDEIKTLTNKAVTFTKGANKRGRPLKSAARSLNVNGIDFTDKRKLRKLIDELVIEIDKSIKRLES